jgi:nitrogen fixation-related uncharacterized protein
MSEQNQQTLVEKLELEKEWWFDDEENNAHRIIDDCIDIVKQHSDWIPVSELPKEEKDWLVRFRKEDGFGLTMAVSKFYLEAQRFDCFHSKVTHYMELPKPPSEVQEKLYQQEMDKINFCGCGCILPDDSDQCADCGALYDM